jgi:AcrR family transcriptional regulator
VAPKTKSLIGAAPEDVAPTRLGRPPRISRELIADAAHDIGIANLSLKAVAERLGVSVASLYHHIEGRDDLMRLAAQSTATKAQFPEDQGQHWAVWLSHWAVRIHRGFLEQPELLGQYLDGAVSVEVIAQNVDIVIALLGRQGFDINEASRAYEIINIVAIGSALSATREQRAKKAGRSIVAEYRRMLAQHGPDEFPHIREWLALRKTTPPPRFEDRITTVLAGIAFQRGEPWGPIAALLKKQRPSEPSRRTNHPNGARNSSRRPRRKNDPR